MRCFAEPSNRSAILNLIDVSRHSKKIRSFSYMKDSSFSMPLVHYFKSFLKNSHSPSLLIQLYKSIFRNFSLREFYLSASFFKDRDRGIPHAYPGKNSSREKKICGQYDMIYSESVSKFHEIRENAKLAYHWRLQHKFVVEISSNLV